MWDWAQRMFGFAGHARGTYYVYELLDPRFDPPRVFYVGKGTGSRMYQHEKDARRLAGSGNDMRLKHKHKRILEIIDDGYEVRYHVLFRTEREWEAFQVESGRILFYGLQKLANETYGYSARAVRKKKKAG